jgi:hypothetical protein
MLCHRSSLGGLFLFHLLSSTRAAALYHNVVPHTVFDHAATASLVNKWKPQVVGGQLTSLTGVHQYARARIGLERGGASTLGILDDEFNLFVVSQSTPNVTVVTNALWASPDVDKVARFRRLRQWHEYHFLSATISGAEMENDEDRAMWLLSQADDD